MSTFDGEGFGDGPRPVRCHYRPGDRRCDGPFIRDEVAQGWRCIVHKVVVETIELYADRLQRGGPFGAIYGRGPNCPTGGDHEYTYEPWSGYRNNHGECWKCGDSPGLRIFNEMCDENVRNNECGICGGPRGHYGECK